MSLGKGLSELLKDNVLEHTRKEYAQLINIDLIESNKDQPRKHFEHDKIKELADSIQRSGVLQPIIVNAYQNKYMIVAGERRWRACKLIGLSEIPAIIRDFNNQEILETALVENIQREGLSAIEEAEGFKKLIKEFGYTHDKLAIAIGKSRSYISNMIRLNQLPQYVKDKMNYGLISMGHARCLVGHEHAEEIAQYIVSNGLSVRDTENIVKNWNKEQYTAQEPGEKKLSISNDNNELQILAGNLSKKFGIKVTIEAYKVGGRLILQYKDLEQLDKILSRL
ncbi:MAG: ParB/RepB/Spo0J family partition protein [Rickettsiaceae bacterium]